MFQSIFDVYWYEKNLQNDIVAIYNSAGTKLVSYVYDAWGNFTVSYHNGGSSTTATYNNLTYRGYYYDSDLDMYYLQSRYYDPAICRFINADGYVSTGQGLLGYNMFAYCGNNPVMYVDYSGSKFTMVAFGPDTGSLLEFGKVGGYVSQTPNNIPITLYTTENFTILVVNGSIIQKKLMQEYQNRYPDFIIVYDERYRIKKGEKNTNPNMQIFNSYRITDSQQQEEILRVLLEHAKNNPSEVLWGRTLKSLLFEWEVHNDHYYDAVINFIDRSLNMGTMDNAMHVDLDKKSEGMSKFEIYHEAIFN